KHIYQITLSANQYARVIVEQRGLDVLARLVGGDGKPLAEYDAEMRLNGTEIVEFVAAVGGRFLLEIEPRYKLLPGGKYEIRLEELRAATEAEKSLQEARNLFAESLRLYNAGKYDEARPLIERALELRQKELGLESSAVAAAFTHLARIYAAQGNY